MLFELSSIVNSFLKKIHLQFHLIVKVFLKIDFIKVLSFHIVCFEAALDMIYKKNVHNSINLFRFLKKISFMASCNIEGFGPFVSCFEFLT